jgi:endoglucanase
LEAFTQYLKENQLQAIVTAVGVGKNACTCTTALTQFMAYIQQHAADNQPFGFVGWAMWGVGHAWGDYPLRFTPESELMQVLGPFIPG